MIVSVTSLDEPKALVEDLAQFLDLPAPSIEAVRPAVHRRRSAPSNIDVAHPTNVLWNFLEQLSMNGTDDVATNDDALIATLRGFYDEAYYDEYESGTPYRRGIEEWERFFGSVSERIAKTIQPGTVLDAGCAIGLLVEGLRNAGVDASGFDISPFAISQAPPTLAPYLSVRSITDEIESRYDLITCLEVVEHLPPRLADEAIANLCRHTDAVLFSSSPDDFDEMSHINLRPVEMWVRRFADLGFHRDFSYDASYIAPQAILFRRGGLSLEQAIDGYEERLWREGVGYRRQITAKQEAARAARDETAAALRAQVSAQQALNQLQQRRAAENVAATEALDEQARNQTHLSALLDRKAGEVEEWKREVARIHQTKIFRYSRGLRRGLRFAPSASKGS